MNANSEIASLLPEVPLIGSHSELNARISEAQWRRRLWTLLTRPDRPILNRIGFKRPVPWQADFLRYRAWPGEVRSELRHLPPGFISSYSLLPESAYWLYRVVQAGMFKAIIECGCGISTVIIALAIGRSPVRFLSLEHDESWFRPTQEVLLDLGLSGCVELVHAPLGSVRLGGTSYQAHLLPDVASPLEDLLFIDAPPTPIGRTGVLPRVRERLKHGALIVLDDASRPAEQESVRVWRNENLAALTGYIALGTGLALMLAK